MENLNGRLHQRAARFVRRTLSSSKCEATTNSSPGSGSPNVTWKCVNIMPVNIASSAKPYRVLVARPRKLDVDHGKDFIWSKSKGVIRAC